jgi:LysM repeat protein
MSKPSYVIVAVIIIAIVMAIGVFFTVMYLQKRPSDNSFVVNVEGQDVLVNPVPEKQVVIVTPPEGAAGVEAVTEPLPAQVVPTDTPPPPTPVPPTAVADPYIFTSHQVTGTDTLYSLAQQYNTSIPLMARFGISSTEMIVGNVITIPEANPAYCPGYRAIVVLKGDTPYGISLNAGISLEEFGRINNMGGNYSVKETDVVCIP